MSLVPAVTELMLAELLYLQYDSPTAPVYMYINSTGVQVRLIAIELCGAAATNPMCQGFSQGQTHRLHRGVHVWSAAGRSVQCCDPRPYWLGFPVRVGYLIFTCDQGNAAGLAYSSDNV